MMTDRLTPWIWILIDVSALFAVTLLIHAILGQTRTLARSALWNACLLASLMIPFAVAGLPRVRVPLLPAPNATASPIANPKVAPQLPAATFNQPLTPKPIELRPPTIPLAAPISNIDKQPVDREPIQIVAILLAALVALYTAGALILTVRLIAAIAAVRRLKRWALFVVDPEWTDALAKWRNRLGLARPVALLRSDEVRIPMALGWLRPAIVIPEDDEDATTPPQAQIDAILLHELAHLRRGDDFWNLVQQVVQVVYWFHPLVWIGSRRIAEVREQACDDLCIGWSANPGDYREALVAVASRLVLGAPRPIATTLGLAMARRTSSALADRLVWIDQTSGATACRLRAVARVGVALVVIGATLTLTTVELTTSRISRAAEQPGAAKLAEGATFHAYDTPVPDSAKFHTMTLTVLDDETGKPIPEAEAKLLNYVDLRFHSAFTDAQGQIRFDFPYVAGQGDLSIEVRRNGYVPVRFQTGDEEIPLTELQTHTIRLRRGTTMGGIVVHVGEQPVKDALVVLTVSKYNNDKRPANPSGYEIYFEVPSRTGPDGRWRTDSVPPGAEHVEMMVIHPDFVSDSMFSKRTPKFEPLREQTDRQVMLKGVRVGGHILDEEGKPVVGARIVDSTNGLTFVEFTRSTLSNESGEFHLHFGRNDKQVNLTVQAEGYQPVTRTIEPELGMPPVDFKLKPGKQLRIQVVDPKGQPIAGACAFIPSMGLHKGIFLRRFTDRQGRFEWASAPEESVGYMISAEGFHISIPHGRLLIQSTVDLIANEQQQTVTLEPSLDITLRIIDAETKKLVKGSDVRVGKVFSDGKVFWDPSTSQADEGYFSTHLNPYRGDYKFEIFCEGYETIQTRTILGDEKVFRETVKLKKVKK